MRDDGVYVIRGRSELWIEVSYNKREVTLLPYDHPFSRLFVEHKHRIGHHGVLTTVSKVRTRDWIPKLLKLVKSIKSKCVICRKLDERVSAQVMTTCQLIDSNQPNLGPARVSIYSDPTEFEMK